MGVVDDLEGMVRVTRFFVGDQVAFKLEQGEESAKGVIVAEFSLAWHPNPFYVIEVGVNSPTPHFHVRDGLLLSKEGTLPLVSWRKDVSTFSLPGGEAIMEDDDDDDEDAADGY